MLQRLFSFFTFFSSVLISSASSLCFFPSNFDISTRVLKEFLNDSSSKAICRTSSSLALQNSTCQWHLSTVPHLNIFNQLFLVGASFQPMRHLTQGHSNWTLHSSGEHYSASSQFESYPKKVFFCNFPQLLQKMLGQYSKAGYDCTSFITHNSSYWTMLHNLCSWKGVIK